MRAPIEEIVWHLDVGSSYPSGAYAAKGLTVRQIKWYVSWVQNVVRQFGPYLLNEKKKKIILISVREDQRR